MELTELGRRYGIDIKEASPVSGGIVNATYKAETQNGPVIIQRLSPVFDTRVVDDYVAVQLVLKDIGVPRLLLALDGRPCVEAEGIWRVFEYISHDAITPDKHIVYEAGKALGRFHAAIERTDFRPTFIFEGFHDTRRYVQKLKKLAVHHPQKAWRIRQEQEFGLKHLNSLYLPEDTPKTIIHGDPKLDNFLFKNGKVVAIVDLDTIMQASDLIDLGDALRSWCRKDGIFDQTRFAAAIAGYQAARSAPYSPDILKRAAGLITLELATRFLIDYFEESYFQWDHTKYASAAEHNLDRARKEIEYFLTMDQETNAP